MIAFVVSFVSPHTLPLGKELVKYDDVVFINTIPLTEERRRMGYDVCDEKIVIYNYADNTEKCQEIIDNADCVIYASAFGFDVLNERINKNKLTLVMHERIFKKGIVKWLDPRTYELISFCRRVRNKDVHFLSIGKNAAKDFALLGFNKSKILEFGYFPELLSLENAKKEKGNVCNILWVGRMVDFKRPVLAIRAAKELPKSFHLTMIGDGKLFSKAKDYAARNNIDVTFMGNVQRKEVIAKMCEADILLSTSDKGEGWGVVINEGMNCGCAIVCSDEIGCMGSLATAENAVPFKSRSLSSLTKAIVYADTESEKLSEAAINTIKNEFNPSVAADRLHRFVNSGTGFESGVCSRVYK